MEAEAVELGRVVVVGLVLHDGLLRDAEPVVPGHRGAVGELERIEDFTRHRHCEMERQDGSEQGTRVLPPRVRR